MLLYHLQQQNQLAVLLKKSFATARLQKHRSVDSCVLHVYCSKLPDEK